MWRTINYMNNIYNNRYWINEAGLVKNKDDKILKTRKNNSGYSIIDLYYGGGLKKTIPIHRLVGETFCIKKNINHTDIDHIDKDKNNNHKDNIRFIDKSGNNRNTNKKNETGFRGVSFCNSGKFKSAIRINGVKKHLGTFNTPEEAHEKYMEYYNMIMEEY